MLTYKEEIDRIFNETQAKLPVHLQAGSPICGTIDLESGCRCTRAKEHLGDHVAHGSLGTVLEVWRSLRP